MRRLALLLLIASSLQAQTEPDPLLSRIGTRYSCALVYSQYTSGRPRLVVAGVDPGEFGDRGEIVLIRLPDSRRGRGVVLDRLETEAGVMEMSFVRLIDDREVAAGLRFERGGGITIRVCGQNLFEIAPTAARSDHVIDFDGDNIPEILEFYSSGHRCNGDLGVSLLRWNGEQYESDGKNYAAMLDSRNVPLEFPTPAMMDDAPKMYFVHIYGSKRTKVTIDDKVIVPGARFELEEGCHTLRVSAPAGQVGYAFVEERLNGPVKKRPTG
jgi:hypothetical protein